MKNALLLFVSLFTFLFFISPLNAFELSLQTGYHFAGMNSGSTFLHSGVDDTEFSGYCNLLEATYWVDDIGIYGFYGKDRTIEEKVRNSKYKASTYYLGVGLKYQFTLGIKDLYGQVGCGITEGTLKHSYQYHSERLSQYGLEGIAGFKYSLAEDYGLLLNFRYSSYRMKSTVWNKTYWKPGGGRLFAGIYFEF